MNASLNRISILFLFFLLSSSHDDDDDEDEESDLDESDDEDEEKETTFDQIKGKLSKPIGKAQTIAQTVAKQIRDKVT